MKKAFSLVELLVVVAIIAILAGVLMSTFGGGTSAARAARCLSNMKNLANACQTYGMNTGRYPLAGNLVYMYMNESKGIGKGKVNKQFNENAGWISAYSKDRFPSSSYSRPESVGMYSDNKEQVSYALTNGVLFKYVSGSRDTYVCPEHVKHMGPSVQVNWSYLMNAAFGWDKLGRAKANNTSGRTEYGTLPRADKTLLFSEVPYMSEEKDGWKQGWRPSGTASSLATDPILQYSATGLDEEGTYSGEASEEIGVNHKSGRNFFAHVAFADGHVEKLRVPMNGKKPNTSGFTQLTSWLCAGYDVSFDGKNYNRVK